MILKIINDTINYCRKNKTQKKIKILQFILRVFIWPFSTNWFARRIMELLYITLKLKTIREWWLSPVPHFSDVSSSLFLSYKDQSSNWINRGFYNKEIIPKNGSILDIGCGDGFYDYYFFTEYASKIDAVDIEESAIKKAKKYHSDPKIKYTVLDIVKEKFSDKKYDVIIMDGSIGHFNEKDMDLVMNKIVDSMNEHSFFVGSEAMETLESMSDDHFQVFPTKDHMKKFLSKWFQVKEIWEKDEKIYKVVYFRCTKYNKLEKSIKQ